LLFGLVIVNVPVPRALPSREIFDINYSCESGGNGSLPSASHSR
jgi:hypothetical protein